MVRTLFFQVSIFLVALLSGALGAFPVFVLGLFVPGYTVLPLTVFSTGLFSALGAAWAANLFRPDRSTSDLPRIVGISLAAAAILVVVFFVLTFGLMVAWPFPGFPLLLVVLVLACVSTPAAMRFRKTGSSLGRDAAVSLGLVGVAAAIVVLAVFATCALTPCIP